MPPPTKQSVGLSVINLKFGDAVKRLHFYERSNCSILPLFVISVVASLLLLDFCQDQPYFFDLPNFIGIHDDSWKPILAIVQMVLCVTFSVYFIVFAFRFVVAFWNIEPIYLSDAQRHLLGITKEDTRFKKVSDNVHIQPSDSISEVSSSAGLLSWLPKSILTKQPNLSYSDNNNLEWLFHVKRRHTPPSKSVAAVDQFNSSNAYSPNSSMQSFGSNSSSSGGFMASPLRESTPYSGFGLNSTRSAGLPRTSPYRPESLTPLASVSRSDLSSLTNSYPTPDGSLLEELMESENQAPAVNLGAMKRLNRVKSWSCLANENENVGFISNQTDLLRYLNDFDQNEEQVHNRSLTSARMLRQSATNDTSFNYFEPANSFSMNRSSLPLQDLNQSYSGLPSRFHDQVNDSPRMMQMQNVRSRISHSQPPIMQNNLSKLKYHTALPNRVKNISTSNEQNEIDENGEFWKDQYKDILNLSSSCKKTEGRHRSPMRGTTTPSSSIGTMSNATFDKFDSNLIQGRLDLLIGSSESSLNSLQQLLVSKSIEFPTLAALLPYLEISSNLAYVVQRYQILAKDGCLGSFDWNEGTKATRRHGTFSSDTTSTNQVKWNDQLPCDAQLVWNAFSVYMDSSLPPHPLHPEGHSFSNHFVVKSPAKPPVAQLRPHVLFYQSCHKPSEPHFRLLLPHDDKIYDVGSGPNNLFGSIVLYIQYFKRHDIEWTLCLGESGLNILWVLNS